MNSSFVGYQVYINAANKLKFLLQGTTNLSGTGATALSINNWYHIVVTYDGSGASSGINFYINGDSETFTGSGSNSGGVSNSENFEIGARTGASDAVDGKLSNISVFNVVLSEDDVLNLYNNGVPQNLNNFRITPTAWWPMDQSYTYFNGSVLVARDVISANDGTGVNIIQENIIGNAPGSEASGTGTNLTIADLKGDMKDSKRNAYSINMADYADGVTNPANSGRSTEVPSV